MRWYPLVLFLFLFWLPNYFRWVDSPFLDYWGMLVIAGCFTVAFPGRNPAVRANKALGADVGIPPRPSVSMVSLFVVCAAIMLVLPYAAVMLSVAQGGFSTDAREQSLKLAPIYVPIVVNVFRDALIPSLILESRGDGQHVRKIFLWLTFIFFATFNLAKSFVIINTLAMFMALIQSPIFVVAAGLVLFVPMLALLALLYGGESVDIIGFVFDFVGRRILTLTSELGVDVREFVVANGFYWGGGLHRDFEYELYTFIGHTDLESGWANVYALADAFGRGGLLGVALFFMTAGLYLLFFWLIVRPLHPRYAVYLWALFCTYIFMQGVFSYGLLVSFVIGPAIVLMLQEALIASPPARTYVAR